MPSARKEQVLGVPLIQTDTMKITLPMMVGDVQWSQSLTRNDELLRRESDFLVALGHHDTLNYVDFVVYPHDILVESSLCRKHISV